jgi:hypothetical protein
MYLRAVQNGENVDITYPFTIKQLRQAFPNTSFPNMSKMSHDDLAQWGVYPVTPVQKPVGDVVTEIEPTVDNLVWSQAWSVRDYTAEEQAKIDDKAARDSLNAEIKADRLEIDTDPAVAQLLKARPAQIDAYIEANLTDLASAKVIIKVLAKAVSKSFRRDS